MIKKNKIVGTLCVQHLQFYADSLDIIRGFVKV